MIETQPAEEKSYKKILCTGVNKSLGIRASKTHEQMAAHPRKIFYNLLKKIYFQQPNLQNRQFFIFLAQFDKVSYFVLFGCIAISDHNSMQNFIKLDSDRAKEFTFRRFAWYVQKVA